MSIEQSFLQSLGLDFYNGQAPSLLLSYNSNNKIGPPALAHLSAEDYVKHSFLSQDLFDSYFKFSFVRNPWARAVSIYKYFGYHRLITFETFLQVKFPGLDKERYYFVKPQVEYLFDEKGNQLVDFIGRFENIKEDFEQIRQRIAPTIPQLSHINKPPAQHNWYSRWNIKFVANKLKENPGLFPKLHLFIKQFSSYQEYYTPLANEIVADYYRDDIEKFGYKF